MGINMIFEVTTNQLIIGISFAFSFVGGYISGLREGKKKNVKRKKI